MKTMKTLVLPLIFFFLALASDGWASSFRVYASFPVTMEDIFASDEDTKETQASGVGARLVLGFIGFGMATTSISDNQTYGTTEVKRKREGTTKELSLSFWHVTLGSGKVTKGKYEKGDEQTEYSSGSTHFIEFDFSPDKQSSRMPMMILGLREWNLGSASKGKIWKEMYLGVGFDF